MEISMTPKDLKEEFDWGEAFEFAEFNIDDVESVIYADEGYNDGDSWIGLFKLKNGKFGGLTAWCDYTGWG